MDHLTTLCGFSLVAASFASTTDGEQTGTYETSDGITTKIKTAEDDTGSSEDGSLILWIIIGSVCAFVMMMLVLSYVILRISGTKLETHTLEHSKNESNGNTPPPRYSRKGSTIIRKSPNLVPIREEEQQLDDTDTENLEANGCGESTLLQSDAALSEESKQIETALKDKNQSSYRNTIIICSV